MRKKLFYKDWPCPGLLVFPHTWTRRRWHSQRTLWAWECPVPTSLEWFEHQNEHDRRNPFEMGYSIERSGCSSKLFLRMLLMSNIQDGTATVGIIHSFSHPPRWYNHCREFTFPSFSEYFLFSPSKMAQPLCGGEQSFSCPGSVSEQGPSDPGRVEQE